MYCVRNSFEQRYVRLEPALRHGLRDYVTHGADLRRGDAGIDGLQSAAHTARKGQRVRCGSDYEVRYLIGMLPEGHVDHQGRVAVQFGAVHIGDDAHDLGVAFVGLSAQHPAQRILIRPELRSQASGNHCDVAVAVGRVDGAPAQKRNAESREIVLTDKADVHHHELTSGGIERLRSFDSHGVDIGFAGKRNLASDCGGVHAGD